MFGKLWRYTRQIFALNSKYRYTCAGRVVVELNTMVRCPQRTKIKRIILVQCLIAALVSLAILLISGLEAGYAAAVGSMIYLVTQTLFAAKLFSFSGAMQARAIVNAFYYGEALKLLLTALLFAFVFYFLTVAALPLFVGFIATQFSNWLAPLLLDNSY